MKGWYFAKSDKMLRFNDDRKIVVGDTHHVDCKPVLCQSGLHASKRLIDALEYAPGPVIYRVELGGEIMHGDDKIVGTERTYLYEVSAETLLRNFARRCALDVIHLWDTPEVVVDYLKTGDKSIRGAARDLARAAASDLTWDLAWDLAWDAARTAAKAASSAAAASSASARDAARDAARVAALAARDLTWDAARAKQNRRLTAMVATAKRGE